MKIVILPPQYFGSVGYYAAMSQADLAVIDYDMAFDKRLKSAHRMNIADTRGRLSLTMPITRQAGIAKPRFSDIVISAHGSWWDTQRGAIESAYGRTPFFEYLFDSIKPYFVPQVAGTPLAPHLADIDATLRRLLNIKTPVSAAMPVVPDEANAEIVDLRRADFAEFAVKTYKQIREEKLGFIENLSVLDLIFNQGTNVEL